VRSSGKSHGLDVPRPEGVSSVQTTNPGPTSTAAPELKSNIDNRQPTPVRSGGSTGLNVPKPEGV
jgi:hypothetical protein